MMKSSTKKGPLKRAAYMGHKKTTRAGCLFMAEGEGFEPSIPCGIHAFQACALGRYAIPPSGERVP